MFLFSVTTFCLASVVFGKSVNTEDTDAHLRRTRDVDQLAGDGLLAGLEDQDGLVDKRQYGYLDTLANGLVGKRDQSGDMDKRYMLDNLANGLVGKRYVLDNLANGLVGKRYVLDNLANGLVGKRYMLDTLANGLVGKRSYYMDTLANGLVGKRYMLDNLANGLVGKRGYYSRYGSRADSYWKRPFDAFGSSGLIGKRSAEKEDEQ